MTKRAWGKNTTSAAQIAKPLSALSSQGKGPHFPHANPSPSLTSHTVALWHISSHTHVVNTVWSPSQLLSPAPLKDRCCSHCLCTDGRHQDARFLLGFITFVFSRRGGWREASRGISPKAPLDTDFPHLRGIVLLRVYLYSPINHSLKGSYTAIIILDSVDTELDIASWVAGGREERGRRWGSGKGTCLFWVWSECTISSIQYAASFGKSHVKW